MLAEIIDLAPARAVRQDGALTAPTCQRIAVSAVSHAPLIMSLCAWHRLAGPDGVFRIGRDGDLSDVLRTPLLGSRSMLLKVTDQRPETWFISYFGNDLAVIAGGQSFLGRTFSELPGHFTGPSATSMAAGIG